MEVASKTTKRKTFFEMEEVHSSKLLEMPKLQVRPILKQPKLVNR